MAAVVAAVLVPARYSKRAECCREDVAAAAKVGCRIRLLGRVIISEGGMQVMVAPFLVPETAALAGVSGVYNAIEVLGEPIGSVMFYGPGAGAGATASAVVGDLMQVMCSGRCCAQPKMERDADRLLPFSDFESRSYIAIVGGCQNCVKSAFGEVELIDAEGEIAFITEKMSEAATEAALAALTAKGIDVKSRIRLL